jgi:hypothetical protein
MSGKRSACLRSSLACPVLPLKKRNAPFELIEEGKISVSFDCLSLLTTVKNAFRLGFELVRGIEFAARGPFRLSLGTIC